MIEKQNLKKKKNGLLETLGQGLRTGPRSVCSSAFLYSGGRKRLADATVQTDEGKG